ncbi:hypothetical protein NF700_06915 [Sphingomonadaceae bacterium OTU29MARTA1]|nr:hypothetical protein NF700_06915 [Sphingomonadaceae bacterium OTU29MARTA1]
MRKIISGIVAALLTVTSCFTAPSVAIASGAAGSTLVIAQDEGWFDSILDASFEGKMPDTTDWNVDSIVDRVWSNTKVREAVVGGVVGFGAGLATGAILAFGPAIAGAAPIIAAGTALGYGVNYLAAKAKAARAGAAAKKFAEAEARVEEQAAVNYAESDAARDRWRKKLSPDVIEAGIRQDSPNGLPSSFQGQSDDGSVTYSGTRLGGTIVGRYNSVDGGQSYSGSFEGQVQRNGLITGTYAQPDETGSFAGRTTPSLDRVFGSVTPNE